MANAKKCDRCGKYYDSSTAVSSDGTFVNGVAFSTISGRFVEFKDLCDSCISEFKIFMKGTDTKPKT